MTHDEATETIVRMVRPSIESRFMGEAFDGLELQRVVHDESVTRDDFALITRLMLTEIVRLAHMAKVISVSIGPVIGPDGQLAWSGVEWLT